MATFEVGGDDGTIFLLSCGVPDVEFCWFFFESDVFHFEVDGGDLGIFLSKKLSFCESPEERSFAYVAVSNDDYFIFFFVLVDREVPVFNHSN